MHGFPEDTAYIYETAGNGSLAQTWGCHRDWRNLFGDVWSSKDADWNGKPEIFLKYYPSPPVETLAMFVATDEDSFKYVVIDTLTGGKGLSCCGDVDGDSVDEVVVATGTKVYIYKADSAGAYHVSTD